MSEYPEEDRDLTFDQLLAKYDRKIFFLIRRYVGDRLRAEDLTQETFVRAYRAFPGPKGECLTSTWLVQIALDVCKEWFRSQHGPSDEAAA